jgi:hypothetical protein
MIIPPATTAVATVQGMFVGEQLTIDSGPLAETVSVTALDTTNNKITATFANPHPSGVTAINVFGGFGTGIVPPSPGFPNGSTNTTLKLYGDINGDGNMVYVEYKCDTTVVPGSLYRNVMAFDLPAASKPALTGSQVLLGNILVNPNNTDCFTYMPNPLPVVNGNTYVLDVAITLTVQTQLKDPTTQQFQTETKALLNVSPRNVFDVWQLQSAGGVLVNRLQPMPPTVLALLP